MQFNARCASALLSLLLLAFPSAAQIRLNYLGQTQLPQGLRFEGVPVGGLSGIDYDASRDRFVAISDDRARHGSARFYTLALDFVRFSRAAQPGDGGVRVEAMTPILDVDAKPFARDSVDPESIRLAPGGGLLWSSEGQRNALSLQAPTVRLMQADGRPVRQLTLPAYYLPHGSVAGQHPDDRGVRNNLALESLALSPDGRTLWTATENALVQDGSPATLQAGSPVRLLAIDLASGQPGAEYVYLTDPIALPPDPPGGFATNGVVELLALDAQRFLVLERAFADGARTPGTPSTGTTVRLYLAELSGATSVEGWDSLRGQTWTSLRKALLLDLATLRNDDGSPLRLDNIEGISWGPRIEGRRTLVLVSDNNFSERQFTQFIALSVSE